MDNYYLIKKETLTNIADAVRAKTGQVGQLVIGNIASKIEEITGDGPTIDQIISGNIGSNFQSNTAQSIASYAFAGTQVTNLAFPKCSSIGAYAFADCSQLSSVELDYSNIATIQKNTFSNTAISAISIPNCATIGVEAFANCVSLNAVYAPSATSVSSGAFMGCSNLKDVELSTTAIESDAFNGCTQLEYLWDGLYVKTLKDRAFKNCYNLKAVTMSTTPITGVPSETFYSCSSLSSFSLSVGTTLNLSIGSSAFYGCKNLKTFSLQFNADFAIHNSAFCGCTSLSKFYIDTTSTIIQVNGNAAQYFTNTPITDQTLLGYFGSIYIKKSAYNAYRTDAKWSVLSSRMVSY